MGDSDYNRNPSPHWLTKYSSPTEHAWIQSSRHDANRTVDDHQTFTRPLGLVESSFDADGIHHGGRADMTTLLNLSLAHTLSASELRRRIALAWTTVRLQHVLLSASVQSNTATGRREFCVQLPRSSAAAVTEAQRQMVWVEDVYPGRDIDESDLYQHAYNVCRILEPEVCLSKMYVLPLVRDAAGEWSLRVMVVMGHQICDGLSVYTWLSNFVRILNMPGAKIEAAIERLVGGDGDERKTSIRRRLPPAQEDLYPRVAGNKARQRWFWALVRVLRHVKRPLPPTFPNPLLREQRLSNRVPLEPAYAKLFRYEGENAPFLSCAHLSGALSFAASKRLMALCRAAKVSIGAGCFALAGLAMMEMQEARYPDIPESERAAFTACFPLNPRAFFTEPPPADSCMLAFSEGIVMPFLPSSLPIEGRFRLLTKHANRELKVYQKRAKEQGQYGSLHKHSPARLLATGYVSQIERVQAMLPVEKRSSDANANPQGELRPNVGQYGATCGISSVGPVASFFKRGRYDLKNLGSRDLAADYRDILVGVRARDNEFLVGSSTTADGIVGLGVSYDVNAISQEAAGMWAEKMSELLEKGDGSKL